MNNSKSDQWNERNESAEGLVKLLQEIPKIEENYEPTVKKINNALLNLLNDTHFKVVENSLKGIAESITLYYNIFTPFIEKLIPLLLQCLADKKEEISKASNYVLEIVKGNYPADDLIPLFFKCIESNVGWKVKTGALEVLNFLNKE